MVLTSTPSSMNTMPVWYRQQHRHGACKHQRLQTKQLMREACWGMGVEGVLNWAAIVIARGERGGKV